MRLLLFRLHGLLLSCISRRAHVGARSVSLLGFATRALGSFLYTGQGFSGEFFEKDNFEIFILQL